MTNGESIEAGVTDQLDDSRDPEAKAARLLRITALICGLPAILIVLGIAGVASLVERLASGRSAQPAGGWIPVVRPARRTHLRLDPPCVGGREISQKI
jgi:hypothetical protein